MPSTLFFLVIIGHKPEIRDDKMATHRLILIGRISFPIILVINAIALLLKFLGRIDVQATKNRNFNSH